MFNVYLKGQGESKAREKMVVATSQIDSFRWWFVVIRQHFYFRTWPKYEKKIGYNA
jgi:hypothetical protein